MQNSAQRTLEWGFDPERNPPTTKSVVFLHGSWFEMGKQFAQQAEHAVRVKIAAGIATAVRKYGTKTHALFCMQTYLSVTQKKMPDFIAFLDGTAEMLHMKPQDVYLAYLNYQERDERCSNISVFGSATEDGRLLCGVNCDEAETVNYYAPTVIAYPDNGIPFLSASAMICNCFMNARGLVAMGSCGQWAQEKDCGMGLPNASALLMCISRCETAKEAVSLTLENGLGPSSGENMHFSDSSGDAYVIEHTASKNAVRKAGDFGEKDYLLATNTFLKPEMQTSVWRGDRYWDNPLPRYWTEEQIIRENWGHIDLDLLNRALRCRDFYIPKSWEYTSWDTTVHGYCYGWNTEMWRKDPMFASQTAKWSPEIRTIRGKNVFSALLDPSKNAFYITNGCGDPLISMNARATGNFCRITLDAAPAETADKSLQYAREQIFWGTRDIDLADERGCVKEDYLNIAKNALFAGINYHNLAYCAEEQSEQYRLFGLAVSAYNKAQCYGQLAQTHPQKIRRDGERFDMPF